MIFRSRKVLRRRSNDPSVAPHAIWKSLTTVGNADRNDYNEGVRSLAWGRIGKLAPSMPEHRESMDQKASPETKSRLYEIEWLPD